MRPERALLALAAVGVRRCNLLFAAGPVTEQAIVTHEGLVRDGRWGIGVGTGSPARTVQADKEILAKIRNSGSGSVHMTLLAGGVFGMRHRHDGLLLLLDPILPRVTLQAIRDPLLGEEMRPGRCPLPPLRGSPPPSHPQSRGAGSGSTAHARSVAPAANNESRNWRQALFDRGFRVGDGRRWITGLARVTLRNVVGIPSRPSRAAPSPRDPSCSDTTGDCGC